MARAAKPEPSLSVAEAAETRNCSQKTIRRMIADGTLPAYRVGVRMIRIDPSDLDRIVRRIPAARAAGQ